MCNFDGKHLFIIFNILITFLVQFVLDKLCTILNPR